MPNTTHKVYISRWIKQYTTGGVNLIKALESKGFYPIFLDDSAYLSNWTNDIWVRDFMPIQIHPGIFVAYNYQPNYLTPEYYRDILRNEKDIASIINSRTDSNNVLKYVANEFRNHHIIQTDLVLDGGNVVLCEDRAVIVTNKIFSENQNRSHREIIDELERIFVPRKVIIIPWIQYPFTSKSDMKDIDHFGHSDGFVQYIGNGEILLYTDRDGDYPQAFDAIKFVLEKNDFIVHELNMNKGGKNSWCYINFLKLCHGEHKYIFMPKTQNKADFENAKETIAKYFKGWEIVPVDLGTIPDNGGALHCVTWEVQDIDLQVNIDPPTKYRR